MKSNRLAFISVDTSILLRTCSSVIDAKEKNFRTAIQDYLSKNSAFVQVSNCRNSPFVQINSNDREKVVAKHYSLTVNG